MNDSRAFTLAELVMAVAIMAVVGLTVATVSMALSDAYAAGDEISQNTQTARSAMARIQKYLNKAKLIVAVGDGSVIYWADDRNGDARINISELARIKLDSAESILYVHRVVFPPEMDPAVREALDYQVGLDAATDTSSGTYMIEANSRHIQQAIAEDVTAFEVAAYPACPKAKMLNITLTVGEQIHQIAIRSAASLRAGKTDEVAVSDGQYVLTGDPTPLVP